MLEKNITINTLLIIASIADFLLSFVIIKKGKEREISLVFGIACLCVGLWTLGIAMFRLTDSLQLAYFWNREFVFTAGLIPTTLLHFSFVFTGRKLSFLKKLLIHLPNAVIFIAVFLPDILIKDIVVRSWGKESLLGFGYPLYGVFITLYMLFVYFNLIRAYLQTKGEFRTRILFVFLAISVSVLFGSFFNLFLILLGNYQYIWVGPYASFPLLAITFFAIIRHRLMDIKVVIKKTVLYFILTVILTTILLLIVLVGEKLFRSFVGYNSWLTTFVAVFIIALIFQPLRDRVQAMVDRLFFKSKYDYRDILRTLSARTTAVIEISKLLKIVQKSVKAALKVDQASVYLLEEKEGKYKINL